jgi:hypothetical protein
MATAGVEMERGSAAAGVAGDSKVAQRDTAAGAAPEGLSSIAFEALVNEAARRDKSTTPRSLRQRIADFVEPRISDPTPFLGGRSLSILERLASDILPGLDESEELRSLTGDIIADEIDRHRELLLRLQSDIAL